MKIFRRARLPMLAHVLFAISFGVLLYFGVVGGPTYGPALLGVAATWGGVIVTIEYSVVSDAYRRSEQRKKDLKAAYSSFLPLADAYATAWDIYVEAAAADENATNDKNAAQKKLGLNYNVENKDAFDVAEKKLSIAAESFLAARETSEKQCEEYARARDNVKQLAPSKVRSALDEFDESLTKETAARAKARSGFVNAVRSNLHQPRWPDPDS